MISTLIEKADSVTHSTPIDVRSINQMADNSARAEDYRGFVVIQIIIFAIYSVALAAAIFVVSLSP